MAEDILRDRKPERKDPFLRSTVAYLPYLRNGDVTLRIVRLKGEEEVIIYEEDMSFYSHERLKEHDRNYHTFPPGNYAYKFYPKNQKKRLSDNTIYRTPFSCYM